VQRLGKERLHIRFLDLAAGVHDDHALRGLGNDAQVVRDQDQRRAGLSLQLDDQLEDLRLDRDIQRGGRLIGNQHLGIAREGHGDHRALAHAAGELVRILAGALLRLGDPNLAQHLHRLFPHGRRRKVLVQADRLADLLADAEHRVERGHRLLEDHRQLVAAHVAHRGLVERQQVAAVERDRAADDASRRIRHQAHDRKRGHALAAARFADDGQGLAARKRKGQAVDGLEHAAAREEISLQARNLEHGLACGRRQVRCLGSR
jgi:hypothetical protein